MKRLATFAGWLYSVLYIYLSARSAYAVAFPIPNRSCATPLINAIVFLLLPGSLIMGAIVWRDVQSIKRDVRPGMNGITAAKAARAMLGALCVLAIATIAVPILMTIIL